MSDRDLLAELDQLSEARGWTITRHPSGTISATRDGWRLFAADPKQMCRELRTRPAKPVVDDFLTP